MVHGMQPNQYAKNVKTVRSKVLILTWKVRGVSKWLKLTRVWVLQDQGLVVSKRFARIGVKSRQA